MTAREFEGQTAVVTGASSGIGRAIALALAGAGARVHAIGRRKEALDALAAEHGAGRLILHEADLGDDDQLARCVERLRGEGERLHVLVHGAGVYDHAPIERVTLRTVDAQYRVNVRAPFALTQGLLPGLRKAQGQVVFINSTAGLVARGGVGPYAATKHALRAMADALRDEVNPDGIRVLSVYAGRTATRMQEAAHRAEGRSYAPQRLIQPQDIAAAVLAALRLPRTAELTELRIRPMQAPEA